MSGIEGNSVANGAVGVRLRLIRGFGASALGPIVTIIVQIVSVPVFLHFWGATLYGEWLIISAIPSYLALSDIGFGNVAGSDMTMSVAAQRNDTALDTFQSTWVLISLVSLLLLIVVCIGAWFVPWTAWMHLNSMGSRSAALIMILFSAYVLVTLQNGVQDSAFRCEGNYALGTMWINIVRFLESALATVAAALGGSPLHAAITYLVVRAIGTVALTVVLSQKSPWIRYGTTHATIATIRRLSTPAFAFMAFPIGNSISLQGVTLVVGIVLGPVAVVAFSTMRTLSRIGFQVLGVMARTIWPELSAAFGAGKIDLARNLHRRACQIALAMSFACTVVLAIIGPYVYGRWTRHGVSFDAVTFDILLLVILANSFWYTSSVVPMATNQHGKIAMAYMVGTLLSLGFAWVLMKHFGLPGTATALLFIDVVMVWIVLRFALGQLADTPRQFVASMFSVPKFPSLRGLKGNLA